MGIYLWYEEEGSAEQVPARFDRPGKESYTPVGMEYWGSRIQRESWSTWNPGSLLCYISLLYPLRSRRIKSNFMFLLKEKKIIFPETFSMEIFDQIKPMMQIIE